MFDLLRLAVEVHQACSCGRLVILVELSFFLKDRFHSNTTYAGCIEDDCSLNLVFVSIIILAYFLGFSAMNSTYVENM